MSTGRASRTQRLAWPVAVDAVILVLIASVLGPIAGGNIGNDGGGSLSFAVTDDGSRFDPTTTKYGTGLQGMSDRLAALGGVIEERSAPAKGTTVTGRISGAQVKP